MENQQQATSNTQPATHNYSKQIVTTRNKVCLKNILIRVIEKFGERFQFKRSLLSDLFCLIDFLEGKIGERGISEKP